MASGSENTTHGTAMEGGGAEKKVRKLIVAVDESVQSMFALKWALDNFPEFNSHQDQTEAQTDISNQVYILHVQPALQLYTGPSAPGTQIGFYITPDVVDSIRKSQEKCSVEILQRFKNVCDEKHLHKRIHLKEALVTTWLLLNLDQVDVKLINLVGDARDVICQTVEKFGADLLVMGSHGYGTVKRAFLGSVSDYCVHNAKCPVLIVKMPNK
eukprot:Gb_32063 [translate_table: standard]